MNAALQQIIICVASPDSIEAESELDLLGIEYSAADFTVDRYSEEAESTHGKLFSFSVATFIAKRRAILAVLTRLIHRPIKIETPFASISVSNETQLAAAVDETIRLLRARPQSESELASQTALQNQSKSLELKSPPETIS